MAQPGSKAGSGGKHKALAGEVSVVPLLNEGHVGQGDEKVFMLLEMMCTAPSRASLALLVIGIVYDQKVVTAKVFDGCLHLGGPETGHHNRIQAGKQGLAHRAMDQCFPLVGEKELFSFAASSQACGQQEILHAASLSEYSKTIILVGIMIATYFNALMIVVGSLLGLLLKHRLKASYQEVVFTSSGLVTLVIGISMAMQTGSYLILLFSVVLGGFIGYALRIEDGVLALGTWMERRLSRGKGDVESARNFALGFLNASLLFCSGAMTVVGSIQAGTVGDYQLILVKSIMDGCMAIIFSAVYGPGVLASALFVLMYQGFFTLAGASIAPVLGESGIAELAAVGGVLLMMIGFGLLDIRKTKTGNFLPAMVVAPLLALASPMITSFLQGFGF